MYLSTICNFLFFLIKVNREVEFFFEIVLKSRCPRFPEVSFF